MKLKQTDLAAVKATPAYKWAMESAGVKSKQCEFVKLAADRFLRDLKRKDITFDVDEYARLNRYYSMFVHTKGLLKGERFVLRPDQQFVVGQLVAWKYRETGERRFTDAYKEVARKNGKSWEAGGLAGYHLTSAGESEAEVYTLATSEKQAGESWKAFRSMSKTMPRYAKTLEYAVNRIFGYALARNFACGGNYVINTNAYGIQSKAQMQSIYCALQFFLHNFKLRLLP